VVHIPNGVTKAFRQPIRELARFGLSEGGFILWIGRFVPEKRVADLIGAFRNLSTERRLVLAGELDESDPHVRALKTAAAGDPRIVFTGGLYGPDKAEALTNACLAVFPSDLEGFPIALLEAMRYGLPVLASDIPEHLETVTPGVNGFVFPTADVDALRAEMAGLLAYPEEAASAARNAEQSADAYDWDNITAQTESVYRQAVALTAAGLPPLTK
jgi:glycosyltransferase involved in cell wall biosynthesis